MSLKKLKDDNGFALILTIMIICLIIPLTLQFGTSTVFYRVSASNFKDGIQLSCAAKSGFHYALALLYEDALTTEYDSQNEAWAETFMTDSDSSFEDTKFRVRIADHSSRININLLVNQAKDSKEGSFNNTQKEILIRLLQSLAMELEDEEIGDIVNSIKDWIDQDSEITDEGGIGEESNSCRNGPLKNIEELSLIKGIEDSVYDELSKYLTIYGNGNININTANEKVLASLSHNMDSELAINMIEYRNADDKNDLSNANWYKDVAGMSDITLEDTTVSSTYFEIISTGLKKGMEKKITSIVKRAKQGTMSILSRKID